eukprot:552503_1
MNEIHDYEQEENQRQASPMPPSYDYQPQKPDYTPCQKHDYIPYDDTELKRIGFQYKHIESFLRGMHQDEQANQPPELILNGWGVSEEIIEQMREQRILSEGRWDHLDDAKLKDLFNENVFEIKKFKKNIKKRAKSGSQKERIENEKQAEEELRSWGIPPVLVDRMKEVGWVHAEFWDDLLEHEYELKELGFQNGHISTFKRKFQEWKEEQDSKATQRKMKLLRKLEKPAKKQSSLLKRNIDVLNATDEPVKVRIIGERKYGSFESTAGAQSKQNDKQSLRKQGKSISSKNKSIQDSNNESTSDSTKERSLKGGASAQVSATPVNASLNVDMSKKDTLSKTNKSNMHSENERESNRTLDDERSNKLSDATAMSASNTSQHSWDKIKVGFTILMPNQIIEFPVQISDPNAVVYMTIFSFSEKQPICDNVQIDANFIQIEKVKIEGFGTKIKWQHGVKPPKKAKAGTDSESIAAKNGIFTIYGFCNYLEKQGIGNKKLQFIKDMLGNAKYDVNTTGAKNEMDQLKNHLRQVLDIFSKKNNEQKIDEKKNDEKKKLMSKNKSKQELNNKEQNDGEKK